MEENIYILVRYKGQDSVVRMTKYDLQSIFRGEKNIEISTISSLCRIIRL